MNSITIRNIGPINEVTIDLKQINIIMGPQSSGKSTIAKIISFCQWMEKRSIMDGEFKYSFEETFIIFHRTGKSYFRKDSYFKYESNYSSITYKGENNEPRISLKESVLHYVKSKNIYIPAERNIVSAIPNLNRYNESNDNIMNFIYDWYSAKKEYSKEKQLSILNFGVTYYSTDIDNVVKLKNNQELLLEHASSGFQSTIPMVLLVDHLTQSNLKSTLSVKEKDESQRLLDSMSPDEYSSYGEIVDRLRKYYHHSQFIIEEPEQNLFPDTQKELVYYLLEKMKTHHQLITTTHSPFILYAINNCMLGYLVKTNMPLDQQSKLACMHAYINPKDVFIGEIKAGKVNNIQDEDGLIKENYFDASMKIIMNEFYSMINYYGDDK